MPTPNQSLARAGNTNAVRSSAAVASPLPDRISDLASGGSGLPSAEGAENSAGLVAVCAGGEVAMGGWLGGELSPALRGWRMLEEYNVTLDTPCVRVLSTYTRQARASSSARLRSTTPSVRVDREFRARAQHSTQTLLRTDKTYAIVGRSPSIHPFPAQPPQLENKEASKQGEG